MNFNIVWVLSPTLVSTEPMMHAVVISVLTFTLADTWLLQPLNFHPHVLHNIIPDLVLYRGMLSLIELILLTTIAHLNFI